MKRLFVFAVALAVALMMAVPAKADFMVGMMAYTDLGVYYRSGERMRSQSGGSVDNSVTDVFVNMPHHSRLYSKCTTEDCGGYFELGVGSDASVSDVGFANANFRKLYGWYNFGPLTLEAGHTEPLGACRQNPTQLFGLGRALKILLVGFGNIYERAAQVNLIYQGGPMYFAAGVWTDSPFELWEDGEEYQYAPTVTLVGGMNTAAFSILPNFTLMHAEVEDTAAADSKATAWVIEVPVSIQAGMIGAKLSGHYGKNVGNIFTRFYNLSYVGQHASTRAQAEPDGTVQDTTCWGGYFDVSFGGKPLAVHLMGGIQKVENDAWSNDDSNTRWAGVIRVPYSVTGAFTLSPEVGYYVFGDDVNVPAGGNKDLGKEWLAGVQFQFVF